MTLKDELFNIETVTKLGNCIKKVDSLFEIELFAQEAVKEFDSLELKERMTRVREMLEKYLTGTYLENVGTILQSAKYINAGAFVFGACLEYVEVNGCNDEYLIESLNALGELTKTFSAEFAIRDFINKYPKETLSKMIEWSLSDNVHERRLASEGLRPKLPWSKGITIDYKDATLPLHNLYYDKERYVTRSTANHLNDISKIDPMFVLELLNKWKSENKQNKDEMKYIINHSLRTLIKKGHRETLQLLGFNDNPNVKVSNLEFETDEIKLNDYLEYSFNLEAFEDAKVVIDYTIYFQSKTKTRNKKTFKLLVKEMKKGEKIVIKKRKQFKHYSTRTLNKGTHTIVLQLNGKEVIEKDFELEV